MKIVLINGQSNKGSTYQIAKNIINEIDYESIDYVEISLTKEQINYCKGCFSCFEKGEDYCPQNEKIQKIVLEMEEADLIVINSPTYCYGMTGQLKTFFDHLGYMWLSHRPKEKMFGKIGIIITTAAGAGAKKTAKSIADNMFYWGMGKVYTLSAIVKANKYSNIPEKIKDKVNKKIFRIKQNIKANIYKKKISIKTKFMFNIMRLMQRVNTWNEKDKKYWEQKGWINKIRPWQK